MENLNHNQTLFSERLLLLHELDYSYNTGPHTLVRREMKLLDTIALILSTGLQGEHFAVAFDKREHLEVVLAKNGTPTSEDIDDAKELFSSLSNPEISDGKDLLPFVIRRCRANVVKRIQKLRASVVDTGFYDDFHSRLNECALACDPLSPSLMKLEFPRSTESMKNFINDPLSLALRDLLDGIVAATVISEAPDPSKFTDIYTLALLLAHSRFLQEWATMEDAGYEKVQRFQRCTEKLCCYFQDVHSLVKHAKRLGEPIKYRWVMNESLGIRLEEEDIRVHAETPQEAVHRASVLSSRQLAGLKERKPSIVEPWLRTVHTCLHAELRIILHLGQLSVMPDLLQPIGVSKPSCLCCALWIAAHNHRSDAWWVTRSRSKPDATWALSACACPNVRDPDLREIDEEVISEVLQRLKGQLRYASITEFVDVNFADW